MPVMSTSPTTAPTQARRVVLVPAAPSPSRGDELVRRYRLARMRLADRDGVGRDRTAPPSRGG
jgi:hypothetical protein